MKNRYHLPTALFVICYLLLSNTLTAQVRTDYSKLAMQNQRNNVALDVITLPQESDSSVTMAVVFNFPYSYLSFKKSNRSEARGDFYSNMELSLEVFESEGAGIRKRNRDDFSVKGLEPATRAFWSDTTFAKNYEQTKSNNHFLTGYLTTSLTPGTYTYVLQLKQGDQTNSRMSRKRTIRIAPSSGNPKNSIVFGREIETTNGTATLRLSTYGSNVPYGKDFYALASIPNYDSNANYKVDITNLEVTNGDTSSTNTIYSRSLKPDDIRSNIIPGLAETQKNGISIDLSQTEKGYTYALIHIPNKKFPNAIYRFSITKNDQQKPVATTTYRSLWRNMPTSLLSLDVAIDMLHYIVDDKTLGKLSSGTAREREKKFRSFWKEKDPTPETAYNELMAEYYRRIDYAYTKFSSSNELGYKSDRGEIYIKFGPPKNIDRKFPTEGPTTEIWTYPSHEFVFQATTGFGDFKLVSKKSL